MTNTIHIDKPDEHTQKLFRLAFPSYSGRKLKIRICSPETTFNLNSYWDGGSKTSYAIVRLDASGRFSIPSGAPGIFGGINGRRNEREEVHIPPDCAIVEHDIFCGKDMGLTLCIRSDNAAGLIPEPVELSFHEKVLLCYTASLKSFARFDEAHRDTRITQDQWDSTKEALIARKLLRKNGSITPDGRNAIGDTRSYDLRQQARESEAS